MLERAAYVLVGGESSRFGQDKARYSVDGSPMAMRVARIAAEVADSVTLVGNPERYSDLNLRRIGDASPAAGPLSGLVAALEDTAARWTLVLACDMPGLRGEFLEMLFQTAESGAASAVLPVQRDGRVQPLCAVYSKALYAPLANSLRRGVSKLTVALGGLNLRYLNPPEYQLMDPAGDLMLNINRPGDLA
jgi:molybdopterin-guanine dinucleotide biosynthesis protein A